MSVSKMIMGQAANRYEDPVNVENLFSTHLYTGNGGSTATINNGIDLTGKGGLVWIKARNAAENHVLFDTDRGVTKYLSSNLTNAEATSTGTLTNFYNNGFKVDGGGTVGSSTDPYASWTFRKQAKFFDIVTYEGNSQTSQTIAHSLGSAPGMMIIKRIDGSGYWWVYHRSLGADYFMRLSATNAREDYAGAFNDTEPTATHFTVGSDSEINYSNRNYVAYLFAHNNNDGGFGLTNDQDIIKCGSYTGNGSTDGPTVNLGFEPQWLMIKNRSSTGNWGIFDNMRGVVTGANDNILFPDLTQAEGTTLNSLEFTSTGFKLTRNNAFENSNGDVYIYMAIRRGDMAVPTDATKVFNVATKSANEPAYVSNFTVDMALRANAINTTHDTNVATRLTGKYFGLSNSTYQFQDGNEYEWDYMDGWNSNASNDTNSYSWMWKRARGYFDVVAYTGDGGAGTLQNHNLGVVPEMIWIKRRDSTGNWGAYHKALPSLNKQLYLDLNGSYTTSYGNHIAPTATQFCVGGYAVMGGTSNTNASGGKFIAYLFATVPNVSKVGSFVGDGNNGRVIDCGFSSGARFILIKGATNTENWYVFDTVRGIVAGNDARLQLDNTSAEFSNVDLVDPSSSGFIVNSGGEVNASGITYIFYAIA